MADKKSKRSPKSKNAKNSLSRFMSLIDELPVSIFEVDSNAHLTYFSRHSFKMFGYDLADYSENFSALRLLSPECHEKAVENISRSLKGQYLGINEYAALRKDGSTFPVLIHSMPIQEDGRVVGIRGYIVDISSRKEIEKQLLNSQTRYQTLVETVSDWIWEVDRRGVYTYCSPRVMDILGYSPEEVIGKKFSDFMEPKEAERVSAEFRSFLESRSAFSGLVNFNLRKDGGKVCLETSGEPIFDKQRRLNGYRGVDRDITVRKQYEEELKGLKNKLASEVKKQTRSLSLANAELEKRETLYRGLIETMNEGLIVTDKEKRIVFVNPKLCEITGWNQEELKGKPFEEFLTESERQVLLKESKKRRRGEEAPYALRLRTRSGHHRWIRISPRALKDEKGAFKGTLAVFADVTALKEAEATLKKKNRNLEEANTALKVLIKQQDESRRELEKQVLSNVKELILPYLERARKRATGDFMQSCLSTLETNLRQIVSPFSVHMDSRFPTLTPTELRIADLVRSGRTSKEIGELLGISPKTVAIHRGNIRRKMGIQSTRQNLTSLLNALY